jgi:arylformamidase
MGPTSRFLDVSVRLAAGIPAYPGNPEFQLDPIKRVAEGASSNVSKLVMGTHTGTHVDAPRHFFDGSAGVDALPLDVLIGPATVVDIGHGGGIEVADVEGAGLDGVERVLFKTPNSSLWTSGAFHPDYAYVSETAARRLVEQGVRLVGVDYLSVEQFRKPGAPAHRALLSAGVVIVEGLNLSGAEPGTWTLYCLPLCVAGGDGAPARVVLGR